MFKRKSKHSNGYKNTDATKILKTDSPFAIKEAYSSVRTNLMFTNKGEKCPVYIVTSALPNDGKSINCVNIAISFAQMGKNVLIIDMDMRNPTIHQLFELELEDGVSEILAGLATTVDLKETIMSNLKVLSAGKIPPNPAELLSSERMSSLLSFAREHFDYIFIDTPPVEVVSDASIISKEVTGIILIVKNGFSDILIIKHTLTLLEQVGADVVGFLLNDVNPKNQPLHKSYKYFYKYSKYKYNYEYSAKLNI